MDNGFVCNRVGPDHEFGTRTCPACRPSEAFLEGYHSVSEPPPEVTGAVAAAPEYGEQAIVVILDHIPERKFKAGEKVKVLERTDPSAKSTWGGGPHPAIVVHQDRPVTEEVITKLADRLAEDLWDRLDDRSKDPESGINWRAYVKLQLLPILNGET